MSLASSARRTVLDWTTIALFLGAILAPTVDRFLRPDAVRGPYREGKNPDPPPAFALDAATLASFPQRCESWFNDTLGFRDKLLRWNSIEKLEVLGVSPSPRIVVPGLDDWMIYCEGRTMRVWRGLDPFSPEELETWKRMLERNRDWLAARGIGYLFALGPNKETIYPEKVPARFNRVGPTRFDQLSEYLRERSTLRIVDLRPALLAAKQEDTPGDELYLRDGTHWNARGSFVAYREIVAALAAFQPGLEPLPPDRFETYSNPTADSWRYRMWVDDRNPQSARSWTTRSPRSTPVHQSGPGGTGRVRVTELPTITPLRVLLLHDSFAAYCQSLLEETLPHLAMHWTHRFDANLIEVEKPTVVVHFLVERALVALAPTELELKETPTDRELFERSTDSVYRLDLASITAWGDAVLAPGKEGGIEAGFADWKGLAVLPERSLAGGAVLYADVTTPVRTSLLVFYKNDPAAPYAKRQSLGAQIEPGRNRIYIRIQQPGIRGGLGVRIGEAEGRLTIHDLEIRRLPR